MDEININQTLVKEQGININPSENININVSQEVVNIDKKVESYSLKLEETPNVVLDLNQTPETVLNFDGVIVNIDANYPQAVEAARIATEKAAEATQIVEGFDEHAQEKIAEYNSNASDKIAEYNQNATEKTNTFNSNATSKTTAYKDNASDKLSAYNTNDTEKTSAYNTNAQNKLDAYNLNDTSKTNAFNQNATDKTDAFNSNVMSKTGDFNDNATSKTTAFNDNATSKTTAFNENASEKQALVDASAQAASQSAAEAKQWAIGDPSEPTGNSAKYWAEYAQQETAGVETRVTVIEGKIPSTATSSNKLTDKSYVDSQDNSLQTQIDAIVASSDVYDIVGTYAELQVYDISTVPVNDIIKVLVDETHSGAATYYRCVENSNVKSWSYIGAEGAYYTKGETNTLLSAKQDTLVSGTNIKTINNNSILGSGNLDINGLPTQTGQSGKFLTTDGTDASWADVDALPSQTGQSGKYLTTDGSSASWATLSVNPDNKSITTNSSDELQTVGVINSRDSSTAIKTWTGTKAQYDAIVTKDPNTLYNITDDSQSGTDIYSKTEVDTLLNGKADIDLSNMNPTQTVKNTIIRWLIPDYANGQQLTGNTFTSPSIGFVTIQTAGGTSGYIYVNGNPVGIASNSSADSSVQFYVDSGDVITLRSGYTFAGNAGSYFYPLKGVN